MELFKIYIVLALSLSWTTSLLASRRDQNGELADLVWAVGKGNYESVDGEILPLINDQERLNGYLNPFIALLLNGMKKYDVNNKIAEQSFWATRGKKGNVSGNANPNAKNEQLPFWAARGKRALEEKEDVEDVERKSRESVRHNKQLKNAIATKTDQRLILRSGRLAPSAVIEPFWATRGKKDEIGEDTQ